MAAPPAPATDKSSELAELRSALARYAAERLGVEPVVSLDLTEGVRMELSLVPEGEFVMGRHDGDGDDHIMYSCIYSNIQLLFNQLAFSLTPDDQLFVFTTDHGDMVCGHGFIFKMGAGYE